MAWHESLIDMFHEREESEREKQLLHEEKIKVSESTGAGGGENRESNRAA